MTRPHRQPALSGFFILVIILPVRPSDIRDFSRRYNPVIRGWIEYYGKFWYRNFSYRLWSAVQSRLLKWMKSKYRISVRKAEHKLRLVRRAMPHRRLQQRHAWTAYAG